MVRKHRLTHDQGEVLLMLEECGAEELPCIVATLEPHDLRAFEGEVMGLIRLGLVALYRDLGLPGLEYVALTDAEVGELRPFRYLLSVEPDRTHFAGIMLTDAGREAVRK